MIITCLLSLGQGTAAFDLTLDINTATNMLSMQWKETQVASEFRISYRVSARTVLLFNSDDILLTKAMAAIDDSMYEVVFGHNITNATYFVEGVTIIVTVVTRYSVAIPASSEMATIMAQGSKCMIALCTDFSLPSLISLYLSSPSSLSPLSIPHDHSLPHCLLSFYSICSTCGLPSGYIGYNYANSELNLDYSIH